MDISEQYLSCAESLIQDTETTIRKDHNFFPQKFLLKYNWPDPLYNETPVSFMKDVLHEISRTTGYTATHKIGRGSFGTVYAAKNGEVSYAIKLEHTKKATSPQLSNEHTVYAAMQGVQGIPKLYFFGACGEYSFVVTQLLDYSLSDIFDRRGCFSSKTIAMLGKRIIKILEALHSENFLYRDMKPENIMVCGSNIFLVDFGMCKRFFSDGSHIPLKTGKVLTGTARYASKATHDGLEQGRRDDIEGLCYVLAFLARGDLPWMRLPAPTRKEKYAKIGEVKGKIHPYELMANVEGGSHISRLLEYAQGLEFEQKPDYRFCISIFENMLAEISAIDDGIFDWCPKETPRRGFVDKLKRMFSLCGSSHARSQTN